ncbi:MULTISPECIES: WYL domain-containing protein [Vibrio]|nr:MULTISPECIES: WYL domain-containing protein [Vibrio]MBF4256993.1 WYL domain-containing protein [Vibrio anguillarum]MBF4299400.1 WYL domain-containing protein [Vibrio anguillarum]MBF4384726.1 WYL domain-containing protein [Vibrio anguillarum]MBF4393701.1 WYL domain-containing protein [Vibrio anguillarum]MBF4397825.1 WYL domain-containing protein [Vibrio anguillarum]
MMDTETKFTNQQTERFKALEYMLYWEGGTNATRLSRFFGVHVNVISKAILLYRQAHPGNLVFDGKDPEKVFIPAAKFTPKFTRPAWSDYVDFIFHNANQYVTETYGSSAFSKGLTPIQSPKAEVTRQLFKAIRTGKEVMIDYCSRTNPLGKSRLVTPFAIANDGLRWHCRAYCHTRERFADFNLGRIMKVELQGKSSINFQQDTIWFTFVDIEIGPHPELTQEEQNLVLNDFGYDKPFKIRTRGSLVDYTIQYYRIAKDPEKVSGKAFPLVVLNSDDIKEYYFPEV